MTEFKVGDKIAAAVLSYKRASLRVGRIVKIHPPTGSIRATRYTILDDNGDGHVVSHAKAVQVEADEYHTMDELYEYRMLYNAFAALHFDKRYGGAFKSWRHDDGELCFGGGWFIVCLHTIDGWVTNHYKAEHWGLFDVPEKETGPEYDGHTPAEAAERLRKAL